MIDLSQAPIPPYDHQVVGVERMFPLTDPERGRIHPGCFALFDQMGAGKTKQAIDLAQALWSAGELKHVVVIAPASVRSVWFDPDPDLGEIAKHRWPNVPTLVNEFHQRSRWWGDLVDHRLTWWITNYEFIRIVKHDQRGRKIHPKLEVIYKELGKGKTLLILDESSAVKTWSAVQTKASVQLRRRCARVLLLNGSPTTTEGPADLFSQAYIMDPRILGCSSWTAFRARYAITTELELPDRKHPLKIVQAWRHKYREGCCELSKEAKVHEPGLPGIEEIQEKMAPYVLRRLKEFCLDLPPKLPAINLEPTLSKDTWATYREMRDEFIIWLKTQPETALIAPQAGVRTMRLAQITSGFVGGLYEDIPCDCMVDFVPDERCKVCGGGGIKANPLPPRVISNEKVSFMIDWLKSRLEEEPNFKVIVWCRFINEVERLYDGLKDLMPTAKLWGNQTSEERDNALYLLHPSNPYTGAACVVGVTATGSMGINLSAAHHAVYFSNDYNLLYRMQSEDRIHRPGQKHPVNYYDVLMRGPKGQRTVDHFIIKSLRGKHNMADWTSGAWVAAFEEMGICEN